MKVTRILTRNHPDVLQCFRRMVFNVLAHNRDDHVKNFAFRLAGDGSWELAPAYELVYSTGPGEEHSMTIAGEGRQPMREHILRVAESLCIAAKDADSMIEEVCAVVTRQPFVPVNCSAVVPTLLENEFFGHERGAFTGAERLKIGKLEYAGQGIVFLDEIGDMPPDLEAKLLRVLQEGALVRVGGLEPVPMKARVIAATHRDLVAMVREGRFRSDLFYRLSVSRIP